MVVRNPSAACGPRPVLGQDANPAALAAAGFSLTMRTRRALLRYWFPKLGGRRQCYECGFLSRYGLERHGNFQRDFDKEFPARDRLSVLKNREIDRPGAYQTRCYRGIWPIMDARADNFRPEMVKGRQCGLFFAHQPGASPVAHLDRMGQATNRWFMFWAVLGATGIGGTISGLLVALVGR